MKIIFSAISLLLFSLLFSSPSYANSTAVGLNIVAEDKACATNVSFGNCKRICVHCLDQKLLHPNFSVGDSKDSSGKPGNKGNE